MPILFSVARKKPSKIRRKNIIFNSQKKAVKNNIIFYCQKELPTYFPQKSHSGQIAVKDK
jgi:hypothetical protein